MNETIVKPFWQQEQMQPWVAALNEGQPEKIQNQRQQYLERFLQLPWPSRSNEAWRYLRVERMVNHDFTPEWASENVQFSIQESDAFYDFVFFNGVLQTELGGIDQLPEGVDWDFISLLPQAESHDQTAFLSEVQQEKFFNLNQALATPGVTLTVAAGVIVDKPIRFLHFYSSESDAAMVHTQQKVVVNAGASLALAQRYCSLDEAKMLVTDVTDVQLYPSANLHYVKSQRLNNNTVHCARTLVNQQEKSQLSGFSVMQGGQLCRDQLTPLLLGERSAFHWSGLLLAKQRNNLALFCDVKHLVPNASSNQVIKSIARDQAQAVINGHIYVAEGAGGTAAHLQNKNLLLSDAAQINTKPQLEIYTDDVVCSHGATIGQLDEQALFYMQSRGISKSQAKQLLEKAFILDVVDAYELDILREGLYQELEMEGLLYD